VDRNIRKISKFKILLQKDPKITIKKDNVSIKQLIFQMHIIDYMDDERN